MKKFLSRLDFKFNKETVLGLIILLLTLPAILWLPVKYTYENSLIENFQLIILCITFVLCLKSKTDKKLFNSLALLCTIFFIREINFGRTVFFPIEGVENAFYSWKEIPFGYLAEPIEGIYIFLCGLYFLLTKSYKILWIYFLNAKISVYNWLFLIFGVIGGIIGEKIGNFALEEMAETLIYVSFMALILLHGFNQEYIDTKKGLE